MTRESRPAGDRAAKKGVGEDSTPVDTTLADHTDDRQQPDRQLPDISEVFTADDFDDLADRVDGAFVLIVKTRKGRYRRRVFLSLSAAEKSAHRAHDRGDQAEVMLCQLQPVFRIGGDQ